MNRHASEDGLNGGRWVPVKGVLRWMPDPEPEPAPDPPRPLLPIACTHCGARMDEHCKDALGRNYYKGHIDRLNLPPKRLCQCGAELGRWRRMCDPCAVEARRATWRGYRAERRAAERGERVAS